MTNPSSHYPLPNYIPTSGSVPRGGARGGSLPFVLQIFSLPRWKSSSSKKPPQSPLSSYFRAEEYLGFAVNSLEKVRNLHSPKFLHYAEKVHRAQKALLRSIYLIYNEMDNSLKASREYRASLPNEEQNELDSCFSESILFAAQALCRGFQIRGIEHYTQELTDSARQLCASLDALRYSFRSRAISCPQPPYEALNDVLVDFDIAWTQFEKDICFRYFGVGGFRTSSNRPTSSQLPPDSDMFIILITEAAQYAIERGILDCSQIDDYDPQAMIALPRLAIIAALSHMPSLLNITHPEQAFSWFQPYTEQLLSLGGKIKALEMKDLELLERWLSFSETISETNTKLHPIYVEVASIADAFQSGEHASQLLLILKKVFTLSAPSSTPNIQLSHSLAIGHQKGALEEILESGLSI